MKPLEICDCALRYRGKNYQPMLSMEYWAQEIRKFDSDLARRMKNMKSLEIPIGYNINNLAIRDDGISKVWGWPLLNKKPKILWRYQLKGRIGIPHSHTSQTKLILSEKASLKWQKPEHREKVITGMKRWFADPEHLERVSLKMKKVWANTTPDKRIQWIQRITTSNQRLWADPVNRAKFIARGKISGYKGARALWDVYMKDPIKRKEFFEKRSRTRQANRDNLNRIPYKSKTCDFLPNVTN